MKSAIAGETIIAGVAPVCSNTSPWENLPGPRNTSVAGYENFSRNDSGSDFPVLP